MDYAVPGRTFIGYTPGVRSGTIISIIEVAITWLANCALGSPGVGNFDYRENDVKCIDKIKYVWYNESSDGVYPSLAVLQFLLYP